MTVYENRPVTIPDTERARLIAVALIRARKWDGEGVVEFPRLNAAWHVYALGSVGELTEGDDYIIYPNGRNRDA